MFDAQTTRSLQAIADRIGVELAALLAVIEVESAGVFYARVDGEDKPLIRWEGHYFDRLLSGHLRQQARDAGLASPRAQAIANPRSQQRRYDKLARAMLIDREAAIMSCSWGVGQVMGAHWRWLGYNSASDFKKQVSRNVLGQIEAMVRFIVKADLVEALQERDWRAFARGYNGPAFARNQYDERIAAAYARHGGMKSASDRTSTMLRMGSRGPAVRELQHLLTRAGYALVIDGDFGPVTKRMTKGFQRDQGLIVDGIAGPQTMRELAHFRNPDDRLDEPVVAEKPGVARGAVAGGAGVAAQAVASEIEGLAGAFGDTDLPALDGIVTGLRVVAAVLMVGGALYLAYAALRRERDDP